MELTTWQRTMLEQAVGSMRGTVAVIRVAVTLLGKLEMTDKEKESVGLVDDGPNRFWTNADKQWKIALTQNERQVALNAIEMFPGWRVQDSDQVIELEEMLKGD